MKILAVVSILYLLTISEYANSKKADFSTCTRCLKDNSCKPPDCFCCRDDLNLLESVSDIPQIVFFTFDDALTTRAADFYNQLFNVTDRKNPNGCPISMTMFISHHDTKYNKVNEFYKKGMEIAAHSVTHEHMTTQNFLQEAKTQKSNLARLGGVPEKEIVGWRSPFLEPVGDMQPDKLKELGYIYDATLTFSKRNLYDKSPTPFTLDFGWPYDCKVKPCPLRRHLGFWEVPVVSLLDYKHQYDCVYVDGCNNPPPDESMAYKFLMDNFNSYYTRSKVPFGINMHPSWFYIPHRLKAMDRFIQTLLKMNDVYIVSVDKMIKWLKNPTPLSKLNKFEPWGCPSLKPHSHHKSHSRHTGRNTFNFKSSISNRNRFRGSHAMSREEAQRRHIQARLRQIAQMRAQIAIDREKQLHQQKHHNQAREKWWSRSSIGHKHTGPRSHSNGHQYSAHDSVHSKSNPNRTKQKNNKTSPKFQFSETDHHTRHVKSTRHSKTPTPFWKTGKSKPKAQPPSPIYKSSVPWWKKPVPKLKNVKKVENLRKTTPPPAAPKPIRVQNNQPMADFVKQLKEQQQQQQKIIEQQKILQRKQLRKMQDELKRNEKLAIERQEKEERKRLEAKIQKSDKVSLPTQKNTSGMIQPNPPIASATPNRTFDPWQQFVKHLMGQRNGT